MGQKRSVSAHLSGELSVESFLDGHKLGVVTSSTAIGNFDVDSSHLERFCAFSITTSQHVLFQTSLLPKGCATQQRCCKLVLHVHHHTHNKNDESSSHNA